MKAVFMMTSSNAYVMMARDMRSIFPGRSHIPCYRITTVSARVVWCLSYPEMILECSKSIMQVIQQQMNAGIVERVEEDGAGEVGEVHYLAHHPVVRQDKQTTKVRVVYDASAKKNGGPSLNDCLYSGPPLSETIADVLVRFRCHKTALVGDLKKTFLMISVAEDDRDAL